MTHQNSLAILLVCVCVLALERNFGKMKRHACKYYYVIYMTTNSQSQYFTNLKKSNIDFYILYR